MPFKKGGPGRKPGSKNKNTGPIHDWFIELGGPNGEHYARRLHDVAVGEYDVHARLKALSLIAGYVWGKPKEKLEVTGADGGPVRVVHEYHSS